MKLVGPSAAVRAISAVLQLLFAVLVAQLLPTDEAGRFFAYFGVSMLWAVIARLGLEGLITREIASAEHANIRERASSCRRVGYATVGVVTAVALFVAVVLVVAGLSVDASALRIGLSLASGSILGLSVIDAEVLRGLGSAVKYQVVRAGALYAFGAPILLVSATTRGLDGALVGVLVTAVLTFLVGRGLVLSEGVLTRSVTPISDLAQRVLGDGIAQLAANLLGQALVWGTPAFLLISLSADEVASVSVSMRIALTVALPLLVVNGVFSARLARSWEERSAVGFRAAFRAALGSSTIMAFPIFVVCMVVPQLPLSLFGADYASGAALLRILAGAQFVSVLFGPVGEVLVMSRNVKSNLLAACVSVASGFVLLFALPGPFGTVGAGIAIAVSIVSRNAVSAVAGRRAWRSLAMAARNESMHDKHAEPLSLATAGGR